MANPTTNLNITLPVPGSEASRGSWGGTVNEAIQSLDTAIAARVSSIGIVGSDGIEVDSGSPVTTSGNITLGVDKSAMLTFLNVEDGAAGNMTGAEIKSAYEAETSAFTDAQFTKLAGIETGATADQTAAEVRSLVDGATDSNVFTDADHTKLDGIEASADVTDSANVNGAGAFMHTDIPDSDTGLVKRTGSETYDIDTSTYLTGNETITCTGDATGSGATSIALTLANSGVTAGSYGSADAVPVLTVDAKGRVTAVSTADVTAHIEEPTAVSMAIALG